MNAEEFADEIIAWALNGFGAGHSMVTVPTTGITRRVAQAAVEYVRRLHPEWSVELGSEICVAMRRVLN